MVPPTQFNIDDVHDDVQSSPHDGPLVVRSIPDDTATFLEMERIAQNANYTVEHTWNDENGDRILTVFEPHSNLRGVYWIEISKDFKRLFCFIKVL
ncbi:hypothetical protein MTR_8g099990 [Medicago truncatula]|uniref:Uncharacterized protein n=1 Tax=Medicago truncatula TaxID=3880 RepID=G7LIS5_MEDTR|nr:hypothetical protein MTR_8g099990 [Medicago truncatula]